MTTVRWRITVAGLGGEPLPPPPAIKGVVYRAPRAPDVEDDAEQTERELRAAQVWADLAKEIDNN